MNPTLDYDSPWKEALRLYIRSFLRLCFPEVQLAIDWSRPPEFLDKELQAITRDADSGKQYVDMLIRVWLLDGSEEWVLLHLEVQHRPDPQFAARLFRYYYRLLDVYGKRVVTLAILADANPQWRPCRYELDTLGTRVRFDFSVCKLLDLTVDEAALKVSREPSAVVVLANWAVHQAGRDAERRLALKWELTRRLYDLGLEKADILELFRLVDWLMKLPNDLETRFRQQLQEFEAKQIMPYITSIERHAIEEGRQEGRQEGRHEGRQEGQLIACRDNILILLEARFGNVPLAVRERVNGESDLDRLKTWLRAAATCGKLEDFRVSIIS